jgi:two-component system chemotaxis sensor kinase CheA
VSEGLDGEHLSALLSGLAAQVVITDPANPGGLGRLLNSLEQVEVAQADGPVRAVCEALRSVVEGMILGEAADAALAMEQVSAGTNLMQELAEGRLKGKKAQKKVEDFLGQFGLPAESAPEGRDDPGPVAASAPEPAQAEEPEPEMDLDLYRSFVSEAGEGLDQIEVKILSLEESPDDKELLNGIFRTFHTLKGTSGFLNLPAVHHIAHHTENLLGKLRDGALRVNHDIVDFVLDTTDLVKGLVEGIPERLEAGQTPEHEVDLAAFDRKLAGAERGPISLPIGEMLIEKGVVSPADVAEALTLQSMQEQPARLGQILVEEGKVRAREVNEALREQKQIASEGTAAPRTVRVDTGKLDNLVDMVGELVITQSQVRQNPQVDQTGDQKLTRDLSQLSRIILDLQRTAMSLRMVPIRQTFQKMIRLVRDLAKKSGKEVELVMHGEETEIDRNMVDEIYEPLVHLVRNAVDHGLEPAEERQAGGKPPCGQVLLRAYHKGGSIVIEIDDDGRGLNRQRILAKAQEKGLIERGEHLDDQQVFGLIFEAGFSTVDKVSEVSGRGVGMDVVRRAAEKLHGKIDVHSQPGQGATIAMRLPLTMAIIDGMVVRVGPERYIVPTAAVRESLRLTPGSYFTVKGRGEMVNIRGGLNPLVRLHRLFGVRPRAEDPYAGLVVVVENEGRQKCFLVDELLGKQELVIKSLGEALRTLKGVAGGAILGDGRVGLILDVAGLFELSEGAERAGRVAPPAVAGQACEANIELF